MLRLDNPGNYSTPIGAADRIDIVRGPASVIYGPSKIGGYMNFVPKTARAANGTYAPEAKGDIQLDLGSWGRKVLKASVTGPGKVGGHEFGYSLYGELEDRAAITAMSSPTTPCSRRPSTPISPPTCWPNLAAPSSNITACRTAAGTASRRI
jgi:outer membrane receptor protein involved in Fe transport